jgi:hypothetical protein
MEATERRSRVLRVGAVGDKFPSRVQSSQSAFACEPHRSGAFSAEVDVKGVLAVLAEDGFATRKRDKAREPERIRHQAIEQPDAP